MRGDGPGAFATKSFAVVKLRLSGVFETRKSHRRKTALPTSLGNGDIAASTAGASYREDAIWMRKGATSRLSAGPQTGARQATSSRHINGLRPRRCRFSEFARARRQDSRRSCVRLIVSRRRRAGTTPQSRGIMRNLARCASRRRGFECTRSQACGTTWRPTPRSAPPGTPGSELRAQEGDRSTGRLGFDRLFSPIYGAALLGPKLTNWRIALP